MAWKPDYCTAAELKAHLRIADTTDDTPLGISITAASRAVDRACGRQFGVESSAATRYYGWDGLDFDGSQALPIDDLMTTSSLAVTADMDYDGTFETTLVHSTDFDLAPWNAAPDSRPWTHLVIRPFTTRYYLPMTPRSIKIEALFGWTAVPTVVKQATLIQAARFFTRRDAAFGIAGSPDVGSEMRLLARLDPDVALLLTDVRRPWGAV